MVTETEVLRLQQEYTDKYVMIDESRPELARFRDLVGVVKTINYNGRALVEFLDYHANIGWFDVALDYVRVVPKPDPNVKKEKAAPAAKAAAPAKASAVASPAAGGKQSTADILAAARAKAAGGAAPAAKPAGGKMSTADILAASRAKAKPGATAPAETEPADEASAEAIEEAVAPAPKAAAKPAGAKPTGPVPTTTDGKIEYCRKVDAKS